VLKTAFFLLLTCSLCLGDTLVLRDGSRHDGILDSVSENYITLDEGGTLHRYPRSEVRNIELNTPAAPAPAAAPVPPPPQNTNDYTDRDLEPGAGKFNGRDRVTLPAGTQISVITTDTIDSKTANEGQTFAASIAQDVMDTDSGRVVIPKGANAELVIRSANSGGTTGTSDLALDLQSIEVAGHNYEVSTEDIAQQGNAGIGKNKRTGEYVGGGAVLGTLIGAIAGGGKGAAIGAIAGAGAGAGTQVLTRGKSVHVPSESTLTFRLDQPLRLRPE